MFKTPQNAPAGRLTVCEWFAISSAWLAALRPDIAFLRTTARRELEFILFTAAGMPGSYPLIMVVLVLCIKLSFGQSV